MLIQGYHKGQTVKEVTFLDANNDSDEALVTEAMRVAGETKSSLFGQRVVRYPEDASATVKLYTD